MEPSFAERLGRLNRILQKIFSLNLQNIQQLDTDLPLIDNGLREDLDTAEQYKKFLPILDSCSSPTTAVHYQDRYSLHYILFRGVIEGVRYHSIGPFHTLVLTNENYKEIQQSMGLSDQQTAVLMEHYKKSADITVLHCQSVAKNILTAVYGKVDVTFQTIVEDHSHIVHTVPPSQDKDVEQAEEQLCREFINHENALIRFTINHDWQNAYKELRYLLTENSIALSGDMNYYRSLLHWSNALFRKAGRDIGIMTRPLRSLYLDMTQAIENCRSYTDYLSLRTVLLSSYFNIFQEYSFMQYSPPIHETLIYIHSHLHSDLNLDTLANRLGFSTTYILHRFKKEVGMSPMQFINLQRMEEASRLLIQTDASVQEIAQQVGINNSSYFAKQFKKTYGMTPTEFRKHND